MHHNRTYGSAAWRSHDLTISSWDEPDLCRDQQIMSHLRKEQTETCQEKLLAELQGLMYEQGT